MRALCSSTQNCSHNVSKDFNVSGAFLIFSCLIEGACQSFVPALLLKLVGDFYFSQGNLVGNLAGI